ncbi:MAG: type II toxin-antitoxin system RelE/ParE family toxin [Clostridia bacterium]|nr:type II toxin-antitoxin system RelE/ParE family toxin [Clostridia bacterium]
MSEKKYELRVLPLFEEDFKEIVDYIAHRLNNPAAAERLVDEVERAVQARLPIAESFEAYPSSRERKYPYYRIRVRNFTVFYVVIENVMELRRILYNRRDWKRTLGV